MSIQTSVVITEKCMDKDRHWNMKVLAENTRISGPTAEVHKFSTNVGATLKFYKPEEQHKASSILKTRKY